MSVARAPGGPRPGADRQAVAIARQYHDAKLVASRNLAAHHADHPAAGWYAGMLAYLGPSLDDWPTVTRDAAQSIPADVRAQVDAGHRAALGGADGAPEGGQGGSPPSYAHLPHLRVSPVPDGHPSRNGAGASATYGVGDARGTYAGVHLAAARRRWSDPHDFLRSPEQLREWSRRENERHAELNLRLAIESATGRNITTEYGTPIPCHEAGQVEQHQHVTDAFRFRAYVCEQRARCPHCAIRYGRQQSSELESLMRATVDASGLLEVGQVRPIGWGLVLTLPPEVNERLGELAENPWTVRELREELSALRRVAHDVAVQMLWRGPLDTTEDWRAARREVGSAINLHWWSSRTPTNGWHWHAHIIVPNVRRDGSTWRDVGTLSARRLEELKRAAAGLLHAAWPELVPAELETTNLNVRWIPNTPAGLKQLSKRCRYDARHVYADLRKLSMSKRSALVFGAAAEEPLRRLAIRAERLQRVKLARYGGWLAPGQRRKVGYMPDEGEPGEPEWLPLEDGYRRIVGYTDEGVRLRKPGSHEETLAQGKDMLSKADRRGRKWAYRPAARDGPAGAERGSDGSDGSDGRGGSLSA